MSHGEEQNIRLWFSVLPPGAVGQCVVAQKGYALGFMWPCGCVGVGLCFLVWFCSVAPDCLVMRFPHGEEQNIRLLFSALPHEGFRVESVVVNLRVSCILDSCVAVWGDR